MKKILFLGLLGIVFSGLVTACTPPNEKDSEVKGTTPAVVTGDHANKDKLVHEDPE